MLAIVGYLESLIPAELTRIWTGELNASSALSKRDLTWVGSDTSARTVMARGVLLLLREEDNELLIWEATSSASWVDLEEVWLLTSLAPREPKWSAMACPIPRADPVTMATRSWSGCG